MPFQIQEQRPRRIPVTPNATGGYSRAERPDPNSAMETFKRGNPAFTGLQGAYGSPQMPSGLNDQRAPVSEVALNMQADQADQDKLAQYDAIRQRDEAQGRTPLYGGPTRQEGNFNDRWNQGMSKAIGGPWRGLLQALQNAGADHVQTGAVAGWKSGDRHRGFFDTQTPQMGTQQATLAQVNQNVNAAETEQAAQAMANPAQATTRRYNRVPTPWGMG